MNMQQFVQFKMFFRHQSDTVTSVIDNNYNENDNYFHNWVCVLQEHTSTLIHQEIY